MPLTGSSAPLTQGVVMIAGGFNPLIGERGTAQPGDDVVERLLIPVEGELQVRAGPAPVTKPIGDRQFRRATRRAPPRRSAMASSGFAQSP